MRRVFTASLTVFLLLCLRIDGFTQNLNGTVGGFVQDTSKAVIPGATVTATNTGTGIVTKGITNESGIYNFPSLEPGVYRLTAELPGFKPYIYNGVQLGAGVSLRFNFTLEIGAVSQAVEVTADATSLIAQSSASVGQVLTTAAVRELPLASNNVLDLMATMAGVRGDGLGEGTTFAGISTAYVNTTRDGISVNETRYNLGVTSTTLINPDLVGEMRIILSPVDAESGRGNGQVQILTKSGGNQFQGAAVWAVRNSALDANTWTNNRQVVDGVWSPTAPNWTNRHQVTVSYGGPVIKNKTFFFVLYDQQIENRRTTQNPTVLTDCARNGIFRYWEGWANGNADSTTTTTGTNPQRPSVDTAGNPVRPATFPNGTPYTGQLRYFSVFGPVTNTPAKPDCSDAAVQSGSPWNPIRPALDPTGLSQKMLDVMPHANRFESGDGLNTASHQWLRGRSSSGSLNIASGTDNDANRKQINIKFDQHFSVNHKAAVNFSYDWIKGSYLPSTWPTGFDSETQRKPSVLTTSLTSTLSSTLLNEFRFGYRKNWTRIWAPWEVTDEEARKVPLSLLQSGGGFPIAAHLANVGAMDVNNFMCFTNCAQQGNVSPLYQFGNTLSWSQSKHAFKFGGEARIGQSKGSETPSAPIPKATGGAGQNPNTGFQNQASLPGFVNNNNTTANSLLYFLAGSMSTAQQYYYIQTANHNNQWLHYNSSEDHRKITWSRQNELSFFFKDDWKVTRSFTANLGIRYDYYGVPWEGSGLTAIPVGGGDALFGVSGRSFDSWMNPNAGVDMNLVTTLEFVGPKTPNPNKSAYKKDTNNFGPAIGFSWQVPWFGEGKTNVRGGYQITFQGGNRYVNLSNYIFNNQGYVYLATTAGPTNGSYFDTTLLPSLVPITPDRSPMEPVPVVKRDVDAWAFDRNYVAPYIQNFTLSVTRNMTRNLTLDVRYIGTKGVKLLSDLFDLNTPNVFYNPPLFDALERTRRGEDVDLFDQMFLGLNLNPGVTGCNPGAPTATCAAVNGGTQRGSEHLRRSTTFRTALANGDFSAVADLLSTFNGTGTGAAGTVQGASGDRGTVLRRANRGFNVAGGTTVAGPIVAAGLFPENYIVTNPQFDSAQLFSNSGSSNYHSLQVQATLRPTRGLSVQGTYVWSKALAVPTAGYINPAERQRDYQLATQDVAHGLRANGTFELPIGPNKLLLANSSGWLARLVERWQSSFIVNLDTGRPGNINGGTTLYAAGSPDIVKPIDLGTAKVHWGDPIASGQLVGSYLPTGDFVKVNDPQCSQVAASLQAFCTLDAVANGAGEIVLQNPLPGQRGNLGRRIIRLPGAWTFDTAMSKTFRLSESKSLQVRFDAENILNHPSPSAPTLDINGANPLGYISGKGDQHRELKGQLRLSF